MCIRDSDGAMGTLLQSRGLSPGELPESWNVTHPEVLLDIHRAYCAAGADILLSNKMCIRDRLSTLVERQRHQYRQRGMLFGRQ